MIEFKESMIDKTIPEKPKKDIQTEWNHDPFNFNIPHSSLYEDLGPLHMYDNDVYVNSSGFIVFQRPYRNWAFPQPVDRFLYDIDIGYAKGWWRNFVARIEK